MHLGRYLIRREPDSLVRFPGIRELSNRTGGSDSDVEDADASELPEEPDAEQEQIDGQQQDVDANPDG